MKQIILFTLATIVSVAVYAQPKTAAIPTEPSQLALQLRERYSQRPIQTILRNTNVPVRKMITAGTDTISDATFIGYSNPRGTYFLGLDAAGEGNWLTDVMDYSKEGKYNKPVFGFAGNGVIGAWSDTIPCWTWPYKGGDYKKVSYLTMMGEEYPKYVETEFYNIDSKGNFQDSIVAAGGWDEAWNMGLDGGAYELYDVGGLSYPCKFVAGVWQPAVPMQYVTMENGDVKRYQMLRASKYWDELNDFGFHDYPIAIGGLPNAQSEDGLWPLTQAEPINAKGTSYVLGVGSSERSKPYYFGCYKDSVPQKIVVEYEAPQAPLYVERVSLAIGAQSFVSKVTKKLLKLNKLHLEIQDMQGNVLAEADAKGTDMVDASYPKTYNTCLLNFDINKRQTSYGEVQSKGILLKGAYQIVLTGFSSTDDFGIYAAKTVHHDSKASVVFASRVKKSNYEPYIMLHGIMPTWQPYTSYTELEKYGYRTGTRGDTIDINFVTVQSPFYKYQAHHAGQDLTNLREFAYYSSFLPYDSITRLWNLDIECPNYITIGADYETNLSGDDNDIITIWDYYRAFSMYIYAIDEPTLGDYIKVGTHGRQSVFHIVSIDGGKTPEEIAAIQNYKHQSINKVLDSNCQIRIIKDGTKYSLLGTKIN